jgi:hypothetical protein
MNQESEESGIGRTTGQALLSILKYIPQEKDSESSISFLDRRSFQKEDRAGRSVWYDRRLRKAEAAGSNPARSIMRLEPSWVPV